MPPIVLHVVGETAQLSVNRCSDFTIMASFLLAYVMESSGCFDMCLLCNLL